jgi:hypothetical protein
MTDADVLVHEMLADACLRVGAEDEIAADLRGYLERRGLAPEDIEAIVASPPRLALYRRLVRNNLVDVVHKMLPRTRARMNAARERAFDDSLDSFLHEVGPRTHYLRDVPSELLAWATPRWRADASLPPYLADLAAHEVVAYAIGAAPTTPDDADVADVTLDRPLLFADAKHLARYAFAVHELSEDEGNLTPPVARDVSLLVYRDADHVVRFLDLTPLASAILARLFDGEALGAAIPAACASLGAAPTEQILADTARLLADLGERGVLLGAKPAPTPR